MSLRSTIMMFATTLLAVVAALVGYHYVFERGSREQILARMQEDREATRLALDRVTNEQADLRASLVKATRSGGAMDERSQAIRGDFAAATGSMKTAIAEYYQTMGRLPASNVEIGLPAPGEYRGKSLKSATVANGVVELEFNADSGIDGGRIRLVPDLSRADAMGLQWRCESADFAQINDVLPACAYVPGATQPIAAPQAHS